MSKKITYNIYDYTEYPGPRYESQGNDSGEDFYWSTLKPLFEKVLKSSDDSEQCVLEVNLDNTAGYASSFLDEAFGNLTYDFSEAVVKKHLKLISKQEPDWIEIIMEQTIPEWNKKKIEGKPRKPELPQPDIQK